MPLPTLVGVGALTLGMVAIAFGTVMTAVVLVRETPGGRATTMTLNSTAYTLGTAVGGALGGLLVGLSGFGALGWLVLAAYSAAAGLVWWSCPTGVPRRQSAV